MEEQQQSKEDSYRKRSRHFYGGVYPGIFMIVVGVIFLLDNYGLIHGEAWAKLWPVFVIIPGIFLLLRPRR